MTRQIRCRGERLSITGELTVYTAAAVSQQVVAALAARSATRLLDLSKVSELDTAGLQLLLLARRHVTASGSRLQLTAASPAVRDVLELLQLQHLLEDPATGVAS